MAHDQKLQGSILYVEDDEVSRAALGESLARLVTTVDLADCGRAGLEAFARHVPDLVVTDITMPGMNGLVMAREIRTSHPHVPIVVTTAFSDVQYLLEAIDVGVDAYVLKPVDFDRLFAVVQRQLAFVHREREMARHREEQRRLLEQLQAALAEVKRLSGLVPICSWCKKVRDDKGFWEAVETYVTSRSEAHFSHSICPACSAEHFPAE